MGLLERTGHHGAATCPSLKAHQRKQEDLDERDVTGTEEQQEWGGTRKAVEPLHFSSEPQ